MWSTIFFEPLLTRKRKANGIRMQLAFAKKYVVIMKFSGDSLHPSLFVLLFQIHLDGSGH